MPADEVSVDNPVDEVLEQILHFLESWREGGAAEVIDPR
jgi:hypothetical protein